MNDEPDIEEFAPWLVLVVTLVGAFIRALMLSFKGMWLEETINLWIAGHGLGEIIPWAARINGQPPLYYFLLHIWTAINGASPYYARFFSVFYGALTIPIIYRIGKRLAGPVMGLAAAVLLAVSPFHIYFAQDTSMYTLLTFNAAIALSALTRLLTDPNADKPFGMQLRSLWHAWRGHGQPQSADDSEPDEETEFLPRWQKWLLRVLRIPRGGIGVDLAWVGFVLFSAATLLSHNTGVIFFITTNLFAFGLMLVQKTKGKNIQQSMHAPTLRSWLMAQTAILLLWLPWLIPYIKLGGLISHWPVLTPPTWSGVMDLIKSFLNASTTLPAGFAAGLWIAYGVLGLLGLFSFRKKLAQFIFLAAAFSLPILLELLVSLWQPALDGQTLIWTTIPLFLLLAAGIAQLRQRGLIFLVVGLLGTLNIFAISDYLKYYQKENWEIAARTVVGHVEKGDLILFNSNLNEIPFNYYFIPYEEHYYLQVEKQGIPLDLEQSGVSEPVMTSADIPGLASALDGHDRVWLIYSNTAVTDPMGLVPQILETQLTLVYTQEFYGGLVQLFIKD
jgi:hypothetical protein